ncbi:hypothetical protein [uncultured Polaribacter sp.]|uniref:hypothetical protein n=1 Tax=uncultured Polaribacter sp. TaxID=174711 RepID=UPI0030DD6783
MKYIYLLVILVFTFSCQNNEGKDTVKKPKPLMSIAEMHTATENVLSTHLKEVKDWNELQDIDSFFVKFRKITPNEALSNAIELKDLIKHLNDSVPEKFKIPSLTARINILYNEALRLADLTRIGAIKAQEVNTQVDKTMAAFSNINTKINSILAKIRFENEIDIDVTFIGLDTTKMDTFFNKPINQIKEVNLLKSIKRKPEKIGIKKNRVFKGLEKSKQ